MKKLFILLTCIAVLASCSKGNEWDSDHPININVRETLSRADTTDTTARRLTPKEIVQQTWSIQVHNVDEVRRITKDTSYCHTDAFNPEKALEMFSVVQDYHNPDHDIDAAIRLHNKAPWYGQKVLRRIQTIKQYEEYRKIVKK